METTTVYTKFELENALKSRQPLIKLEGEIKEEFLSKFSNSPSMNTFSLTPLLIRSLTKIILGLMFTHTITKVINKNYNLELQKDDVTLKLKNNQ